MNSFQILDNNGQAININDLDKEAAAFWNQEVREKVFAQPLEPFVNKNNLEGEAFDAAKRKHDFNQKAYQTDWFHKIGKAIAEQGIYYSGWPNVVLEVVGDLSTVFVKPDRTSFNMDYGKLNEISKDDFEVKFEDQTMVDLYVRLEIAKPYIELIQHWQAKGYMPKQIK